MSAGSRSIIALWDMRRRINIDALPEQRVVIHVRFHDAPRGMKRWWLVLMRPEVDLCFKDHGFEADLHLGCSLRTMVAVWQGQRSMDSALRSGSLKLEGPLQLRRALPCWLQLSAFAGQVAHKTG